MTSRTWVAVALCCLVWFGYMRFFAPPPPVNPATPNATGSQGAAPTPTEASSGSGAPVASAPTSDSPFSVQLQAEESTIRENDLQKMVFSDVGGKLSRVALKKYEVSIKPDAPLIETVSPDLSNFSLSALFTDAKLRTLGSTKFARTDSPDGVTYEATVDGVKVIKTFRFAPGRYLVDHKVRVEFPAGSRKEWGHLLVPIGATSLQYDANDPLKSWEVVSYQSESLKRRTSESLDKETDVMQGNTHWLAFGNRYFSTALVNKAEINPDIVISKSRDFIGGYLRFPLVLKSDQSALELNLQVYSGPKDYTDLGQVPALSQLIDYGMFSFLAYPLLDLLRFFYRFVHNYGIAIILLTLVVRILFYPLSLKSYRSMKGMQKLQPQLAALKDKYKDDPQRFGQEQMALFRTHKVNPAGGCLPILVQLPVFIALYAVLGNSIELFHAPFFGWIKDLSAMDPFYIFPVLMGLSMLAQQKLTPTAGMDPMQQKILYLMPVVFTFIMLNLPSGLTVYIFLSTLLGIAQQMVMNREGNASTELVSSPSGGTK